MPPTKEELQRTKLAKQAFLKKKGFLQGPKMKKRRKSSISQIAKRMSSSPPSGLGPAPEHSRTCQSKFECSATKLKARKRTTPNLTQTIPPPITAMDATVIYDASDASMVELVTGHGTGTANPAICATANHLKHEEPGIPSNPGQAIPMSTHATVRGNASDTLCKQSKVDSPAVKVEDDISIPSLAGSNQKRKKTRNRTKKSIKIAAGANEENNLLTGPTDSSYFCSSEKSTSSNTLNHDLGWKRPVACVSGNQPKNENLESGSETAAEQSQEETPHAENGSDQPKVDKEPKSAHREAWTIIHTVSLEAVDHFVASHEFGYRLKTENTPSKGRMRYYNCAKIKVRAKPQCARQILVFIPNTSGVATISARGKHTCQDAPQQNMARSRLTTDHTELIDRLLGSGIPSKDVKTHLKLADGNLTKGALQYAVKSSKEKLFGTGKLSLGELEQWVALKSAVPDDDHEAFVVGSDIDHENGRFRITISSKRLLSLLPQFKTLAADCTFKTTLQGYPLLVVCVIDAMRKAHPVAFACISNQEHTDYQVVFQSLYVAATNQGGRITITSFLSDGEHALKNAARNVFGHSVLLLNCYFHVKQNLVKHFKKSAEMQKEVQEQVKREVSLLQVAPTKPHFSVALELFVEKYSIYPAFSQFFAKYARNEKFSMWYEAAQPGVPATNNALEAINKSIKYNYLKRHKEPLGTFKAQMLSIIKAYSSPDREVYFERSVNLSDERKAFDTLKGPKKLRTVNTNQTQYVYIPGRGKTDVSLMDIANFENPVYSNLEEYAENLGQIHRVHVNGNRCITWTCTCTHFFKTNGCAHILVVAVRRNNYTLRTEANTALLSTKKSGGRPKFISKALCKD